MIKKLKNLLTSFKGFKIEFRQNIPQLIANDEKIVRSIFSPINLNKNQTLKFNAFRPPANSDEISVNRLNYTTPSFCKALSKKMANP